ncbi:MAG: YbbR-like domain-containing protein, partial [Phototrophicaceae bacterium]
ASQVQQVVAARAPINLADRRDSLETEVRLLPVDAEGGVVSDVTLEPQMVGVSVAISRRDDVREVTVSPNIDTTTLPDGYVISSIGYAPQTVLVMTGSGTDSGARVPNTLLTERIDLTGRTDDFEITVPVVFPPGEPELPLLGDQVVTVLISITAQASTEQFEQIEVEVIGLEDGLTAQIVPDQVSALVTGPQAVLEDLSSEDIRVVLDLAGREPGTYELTPSASIDQGQIDASGIALLPSLIAVTVENGEAATAPPP